VGTLTKAGRGERRNREKKKLEKEKTSNGATRSTMTREKEGKKTKKPRTIRSSRRAMWTNRGSQGTRSPPPLTRSHRGKKENQKSLEGSTTTVTQDRTKNRPLGDSIREKSRETHTPGTSSERKKAWVHRELGRASFKRMAQNRGYKSQDEPNPHPLRKKVFQYQKEQRKK